MVAYGPGHSFNMEVEYGIKSIEHSHMVLSEV